MKYNFVDESAVFIDGTHIKASANKRKSAKKAVPVKAKKYQKELDEEISKDRKAHDKKPLKEKEETPEKIVTESTTDPECGMYHKGEHERQFAYVGTAQQIEKDIVNIRAILQYVRISQEEMNVPKAKVCKRR